MRRGTDQARDLAADARRRTDPVRLVPAADETPAPFLLYGLRHPACGRTREGTERIAVEIDLALWQIESITHLPQRIGRIQRVRLVERPHAHSRVRTLSSSGKKAFSSTLARYWTPAVPPVPVLNPITRSTVLRCPKRHSWA